MSFSRPSWILRLFGPQCKKRLRQSAGGNRYRLSFDDLEARLTPTAAITGLGGSYNLNGVQYSGAMATEGSEFTLSQSKVITQIGAYDSFSDGFTSGGAAQVGIWSLSGLLITSVSVASNAPISSTGYRYTSLSSSLTLAAGTYYIGVRFPGLSDYSPVNVASLATSSGITL